MLHFIDNVIDYYPLGIQRIDDLENFKTQLQNLDSRQWHDDFGYVVVYQVDKTVIEACPYRGLLAFQEEHAPYFFGREKFVERLLNAVEKLPFVAVIGASGSGKSSLVFAGLIPQLKQRGNWVWEKMRPKTYPFNELARALVRLKQPEKAAVSQDLEALELSVLLEQKESNFITWIDSILENHLAYNLLLVIDQFEELYTLGKKSDRPQRELFLERLLTAANTRPNFKLVITLRADFCGEAFSFRPLADALENADVKLPLMNREELQAAIEKPALKQGVSLESGLTERILDAVENEPGNLPLLEFALTELWNKQSLEKLTNQAYNDIGGVEMALVKFADNFYNKLSPEKQKVVQNIFLHLIHIDENQVESTNNKKRRDTRKRVTEKMLIPAGSDRQKSKELIKQLADERLVVISGEEREVEVAHEALIRHWPRLQQWLDEDIENIRLLETISQAAKEWETNNKDDNYLVHRGSRLDEAKSLWKQSSSLSEVEDNYLEGCVSLDLQEKERLQRELQLSRRFNLALGAISLVGMVGVAIALYPWYLRWRAINLAGEMADIDAGSVTVGTKDADAPDEEKPQKQFEIESFEIDKYEVSNRQYRLCVRAGKCGEPVDPTKFNDKKLLDHPVVEITAYQAFAFCQWVGKRLPTELEWEHAARSANSNLPWEDNDAIIKYANVQNSKEGTQPVGSYPKGESDLKVYDLIGNVSEWTASYGQKDYQNYDRDSVWHHFKELSAKPLVLRGGGWRSYVERVTERSFADKTHHSKTVGVRCVK